MSILKKVLAAVLMLASVASFAQSGSNAKKKVAVVGFYNVENLFDTVNDPQTNDDEFTPTGENQWTLDRYQTKLMRLSEVISKMGVNTKDLPVVVGLAEVENRKVVEDLIASGPLKGSDYGIAHFDSPDRRGIDVALIYLKSRFKPTDIRKVPFVLPDNPSFKTRDVLVVSGLLDGEPFNFVVNHWPSRRGGEEQSAGLRSNVAKVTRSVVDGILKKTPSAKVVVMGDFNDNHTDSSIVKGLCSVAQESEVNAKTLFNPMINIYKSGKGTLPYKGEWFLFDQFMLTKDAVKSAKGYRYQSAKVVDDDFLKEKEGKFAGSPFRTYAGKRYLGGYSDHFAVKLTLTK